MSNGKKMSSETDKVVREDEDNRALWECPTFRRLAANYAELGHGLRDDGNCTGAGHPGVHSCKHT
jgi:hypothetical protein